MKKKPNAKGKPAVRSSDFVRHLAARYLKYLRREVRNTDGKTFPCCWLWLGMIANEARDKLKPLAAANASRGAKSNCSPTLTDWRA